ncbi:fibrillin-1 isoform X2 [Hydra vulgaris]|uniref:fibrillin-1 isoform X2 n=1 Tax=Hydra vulgaris TaxID=6087 RepID=UPI0032EA043C
MQFKIKWPGIGGFTLFKIFKTKMMHSIKDVTEVLCRALFWVMQMCFISITGSIINDSITDSVNMQCPEIFYDSVLNGFHNRIVACSFNNHNCSVQNNGFIYSIDIPSTNPPNNSFNPSNGVGYIYGKSASTFRLNVLGSHYTNIHNFDIYITMALYTESGNKSDFGLFDSLKSFSTEFSSSAYKWDVINIMYYLTDTEMSSGFTFDLQTVNIFSRFDDLCIYQVCKEEYTFNAALNQCEENTCLIKNCQYQCNVVSGNAVCLCPTGYSLSSDNITCFQDPCAVKYCEYYCNAVSGNAVCSCPAGYILHSDSTNCLQVPSAVTSTSFTIVMPNFLNKSPIVTYYVILVKLKSTILPTRTPNSYTWNEINNHTDNIYLVGLLNAYNSMITNFIVGEGSNANPPLDNGAAYTTFVRGVALDNTTFTSSYSSIVITKDVTTTTSPSTTTTTSSSTTTTQYPTTSTQHPTTTQSITTTNPNDCSVCNMTNSKCIKSNGRVDCACNNGFLFDNIKRLCVDIDECAVDNKCSWPYGACNNTYGSFICYCKGDWILSSTNNSCIGPPAIAVTSQSFQIVVKSFLTVQVITYIEVIIRKQTDFTIPTKPPSQYTKEDIDNHVDGWYRFASTTVTATQISSITLSSKYGNSIMVNSGNSKFNRKRRSLDDSGFVLDDGTLFSVFIIASTENSTLTSPYYPVVLTVDPDSLCASISCFKYKNQICSLVNSTSAKCFCQNGFITFDDYLTCEDIDECSAVANACSFENSLCTNVPGSYSCSCKSGYALSNNRCKDINECNLLCKSPNSTCTNRIGSYECRCVAGSFYNATFDSCQDLDECRMGTALCDTVRGTCQNQNIFATGIPYNCSCPNGWQLSKDGTNTCIDVNECLNFCNGPNAFCINTIGSFICKCAVGFSLNSSFQCEAVNLCSQINCPASSNCTFISPGYFGCTCKPGYLINYISSCEEIDQCLSKTPSCLKPHQICQKGVDSLGFTCGCRNGYENISGECKAITTNICNQALSNNVSLCPSGQLCFDLKSSYECRCPSGYIKNSSDQCEDVNECLLDKSCTGNAECINYNGGYDCECKPGFSGKNETHPSAKVCYEDSAWSSWQQVTKCSMPCQTDQKRGKIIFSRFCILNGPGTCPGNATKEEFCNSDYCDNKIKVLKSVQCENWKNMEDLIDLPFKDENETWFFEIRKWLGFHINTECKELASIKASIQVKLESLQMEIIKIKDIRLLLRKVIDCNTYLQKINDLRQKYKRVQSRLVMYTTVKAALKKLQDRMNLKQNKCINYIFDPYFLSA